MTSEVFVNLLGIYYILFKLILKIKELIDRHKRQNSIKGFKACLILVYLFSKTKILKFPIALQLHFIYAKNMKKLNYSEKVLGVKYIKLFNLE